MLLGRCFRGQALPRVCLPVDRTIPWILRHSLLTCNSCRGQLDLPAARAERRRSEATERVRTTLSDSRNEWCAPWSARWARFSSVLCLPIPRPWRFNPCHYNTRSLPYFRNVWRARLLWQPARRRTLGQQKSRSRRRRRRKRRKFKPENLAGRRINRRLEGVGSGCSLWKWARQRGEPWTRGAEKPRWRHKGPSWSNCWDIFHIIHCYQKESDDNRQLAVRRKGSQGSSYPSGDPDGSSDWSSDYDGCPSRGSGP